MMDSGSRYRVFGSLCVLFCTLSQVTSSQEVPSPIQNPLAERANREFLEGKYAEAERDFRDLSKVDSSSIHAQLYLGHSLFRQEKYSEAVGSYERAKSLQERQKRLTQIEIRVLTDQLAMAYGISGQLKKAHAHLDSAIQKDPDYPLNYYNRACAFAEEGERGEMLIALRQAFDRKKNGLKGEQMPDPRTDSSFQKYTADAYFLRLMKDLGLK